MDWSIALLVGALIGWIASLIMKTDAEKGALLNIVIGIVGSLLGRWLFGDVLHIVGAAADGCFFVLGILWGVLGAVVGIAAEKRGVILQGVSAG